MRNTLLASTALAFVLSLGGAAIAADEMKSNQSGDATMEKSTGTSGSATMGAADSSMQGSADSYRSLNAAGDQYSGTIAGGFQADDLIGTDVVDANGETVGEIADVLIDPQNNANHVLVDVGGFLGIGSKRVALPIEELSQQGDQLTTNMTEQELEQLASYEEQGDTWMRAPDEGTTGTTGSMGGASDGASDTAPGASPQSGGGADDTTSPGTTGGTTGSGSTSGGSQ